MANRPKARSDQLLVQRTGPETLVYDERSHRAHCLDARATRIWELCNGERSDAEIAKAFGEGDAGRAVVSWTLVELLWLRSPELVAARARLGQADVEVTRSEVFPNPGFD